MELYTLNSNFLREEIVEDFSSVIWTERYIGAGDVSLVVPATSEMISLLTEGTFLSLKGTKEVMLLDSVLIEKNQLKITGKSLAKFLSERAFRPTYSHKLRSWEYYNRPGFMMGYIAQQSAMASGTGGLWSVSNNIHASRQAIPNLALGDVDNTGDFVTVAIPYGPAYDTIVQLAETYSIGFSLYLDSASDSGYSLKFKTYRGLDRTSAQSDRPVVQFSPAMDSLTEIKELRSVAGYKTAAYAFAAEHIVGQATPPEPGIAYAYPAAETEVGFSRRVLMIFCDDITSEASGDNATTMTTLLTQRAVNALANNNYTKVVDGEVVPQSKFQYDTDYKLGDIVELQGHSGITSSARITEYIRIHDKEGERSYPTVSVIE